MIQLATNNEVIIDGIHTGYTVSQTLGGTTVQRMTSGQKLKLPHKRYALSCNNPASGVAGCEQFEKDLGEILHEGD